LKIESARLNPTYTPFNELLSTALVELGL
jgi:hypothetical protein